MGAQDGAPAEPSLRRAWIFPPGAGDISALSLREEAMEGPSLGELRVRVEAVGLNFADVFTGLALYGPVKSGEVGSERGGFVPGLEFSGVVEAVGSQPGRPRASRAHGGQLCELSEEVWHLAQAASENFEVGDRVMGAMRFGAYASHVNVPAHQLRKIPAGWSFAQGAAFMVQSLTVFYALRELGAVRRGSTVLIHSAAGGCGLQAIEICLKLGVRVVGTVGSAAKLTVIRERFPGLKAEQLIVRGADFEQQLRAALAAVGAEGFHVVLDAVLGDYFQPGFRCMAPGGRYVVYGAASMTPQADSLGVLQWVRLAWQWLRRPWVDPLELPGLNKSVMGFNLIHCFNDAEALSALTDELMALELPPPCVGHEFPFAEATEALRTFRAGKTTGKVVLRLASDGS